VATGAGAAIGSQALKKGIAGVEGSGGGERAQHSGGIRSSERIIPWICLGRAKRKTAQRQRREKTGAEIVSFVHRDVLSPVQHSDLKEVTSQPNTMPDGIVPPGRKGHSDVSLYKKGSSAACFLSGAVLLTPLYQATANAALKRSAQSAQRDWIHQRFRDRFKPFAEKGKCPCEHKIIAE
jgi:hypothetical protein